MRGQRSYRVPMENVHKLILFGGLGVAASGLSAPPVANVSASVPAPTVGMTGFGTNGLRLNFRGAPLSQVLDYLSDAAGFIIHQASDVQGTVDVWSDELVTPVEAVKRLDSSLRKNGAGLVRNGRILTLVKLENGRTSDLEVVSGNDPGAVPKSDEVVTQIIAVRYAGASQLVNNLQPLLPPSASLSVNESANSLILVATRTDIRRMLRIISALDTAIARVSSIKVFPLRYADASALAAVLQQLFTLQGSSQSAGGMIGRVQLSGPPGGGGFGPADSLAGPDDPASSEGGDVTATAPKVVALADERSNSLIASAPAGLMATIAATVKQLDRQVNDTAELRVFHLRNADPAELADQLAQLFPDDSGTGAGQNQPGFSLGGPPPPPGSELEAAGSGNTQPNGSSRKMKQGRVLTVADARTTSLLVSAASTLMPQIAGLIEQLDASPAGKETVSVWELRNADPLDVNQVLQDLFNRNNTTRNNSNNRNSLLGDSNPLTTRQTKQQNSTSTGTFGLGNSSGSAGSGASTGF